eukprot:53631_1
MEGVLEKKGSVRYQERFVWISRTTLFYALKRGEGPKGTFDLSGCKSVEQIDERSFTIAFLEKIVTFRAENANELQAWISVLSVYVGFKRPIPVPSVMFEGIMTSLVILEGEGPGTSGIFTRPSDPDRVKGIVNTIFHKGCDIFETIAEDAHLIAAVLKFLLNELPETLLTESRLDGFVDAKSTPQLLALVRDLPSDRHDLLARLFSVFRTITQSPESNINPETLASNLGDTVCGRSVDISEGVRRMFELMVERCDVIFKKDDSWQLGNSEHKPATQDDNDEEIAEMGELETFSMIQSPRLQSEHKVAAKKEENRETTG